MTQPNLTPSQEAREAAARSKPCPFCDATPHHGLGKVEHCQLHGEPFQRFSIWCPHGHAKVTAANEEIARQIWDTRPGEQAIRKDEAEQCASDVPCTAEDPNESDYQRGYFDGVMAYSAALRARHAHTDQTGGKR